MRYSAKVSVVILRLKSTRFVEFAPKRNKITKRHYMLKNIITHHVLALWVHSPPPALQGLQERKLSPVAYCALGRPNNTKVSRLKAR